MQDSLKSKIIPSLLVLTVICIILATTSYSSSRKLKNTLKELDKQKLSSWDLEQKLNKVLQEKNSLEDKLKSEEKQAELQKNELEATKKTLTQQQLVGQSLTEELTKLNKQIEMQAAKPPEKPSGNKANINK